MNNYKKGNNTNKKQLRLHTQENTKINKYTITQMKENDKQPHNIIKQKRNTS